MAWYRNNRILFVILILIFMLVVYFGYKVVKAIGPSMGDRHKKESIG